MELENDQVRVTTRRAGDSVLHEVATRDGNVVAESLDGPWTTERIEGRNLILEGETPVGPARLTIVVPATGSWVHFRVDAEISGRLDELLALYQFVPGTADFTFAPHIRPADDHVVAQWGMKTPAAIIQKDRATMALVLDTELVTEQSRRLHLALEMEADPLVRPQPLLGIGIKVTEPVELNYFRHREDLAVDIRGERVSFGYYIWVGDEEPAVGYRSVARFLWQLFGQKRITRTVAPQAARFDRYADEGLTYAFDNLWLDLDQPGGPAGGVLNGICYANDIWFQSLFNHLRSAIGMRGFGHPDAASRVKNLALSAPQHPAGPFKTIFHSSIRQARREKDWVTSSHWMLSPGVENKMRSVRRQNLVKLIDWESLYHTVDCSWTTYWMLRWHQEVEADERLTAFASSYGDFLVDAQTRSGAIPSFIRADDLTPEVLLSHNVGTSASAAMLARLYMVTGQEAHLVAARRAARFIEENVLPTRRWQDYEVVFDSGAKPLGFFDHHTQQYAQTTQGMVWTIAMFHSLYEATGEQRFLDRAGEVVDYLSLFQQLWDPPFLSVQTFGGFPVGNSHPSWNDARTPLLATAFADHFALTHEPEYLQRAIAALRASLALMFVPENAAVSAIFEAGPRGHADEGYAGRGRDEQFTGLSFDFPVGAALSSIALVKQRHGDAYVDATRNFAIGIDGCLVHDLKVQNDRVDLRVELTPSTEQEIDLRVVIDNPRDAQTLLTVNGNEVGVFSRAQLSTGVHVPVKGCPQ